MRIDDLVTAPLDARDLGPLKALDLGVLVRHHRPEVDTGEPGLDAGCERMLRVVGRVGCMQHCLGRHAAAEDTEPPELPLVEHGDLGAGGLGGIPLFDAREFSGSHFLVVPEPATMSLLILGALAGSMIRRRR